MKPYHRNPRQITKQRHARLTDTLTRLGDLGGIVHNLNTGEIIGGNQRMTVFNDGKAQIVETLDAPDEQGTVAHGYIVWRGHKFAYRQVRWDEATAAEANIAANMGAGDWNWDTLANQWDAAELTGWGMDAATLTSWKRDTAALNNLLESEKPPAVDAEPQTDRAEELREKWQTERGQLWAIGAHRLLCGDSTQGADVDLVMQGERAELAAVDPPYNVGFDYDGETVDDKKSAEKYETFSRAWFGECQRVSVRQIVTPGGINHILWARWFDSKHCGTWIKTNALTRGRVSNSWCWEPVFFFGEGWNKKRANDVFDYPITNQKDTGNHPCPKPLPMWNDLVENYSEPNAIVYESFGGSGTTLVACQNLSRRCRAIEISPAYCAVILERMATAFPELDIHKVDA